MTAPFLNQVYHPENLLFLVRGDRKTSNRRLKYEYHLIISETKMINFQLLEAIKHMPNVLT